MMKRNFFKDFQEQTSIKNQVARKFGYNPLSKSFKIDHRAKKKQRNPCVINNTIVPRELTKKKVEKSEKHINLLKEIEAEEYRKRMMAQSKQKKLNIMGLMNERIKEYNYLVEHKHLEEKNSEDTKRVLGLQPKSDAEKILEEINSRNTDLMEVGDLRTQYSLNKKITKLYRRYKDKMYEHHDPFIHTMSEFSKTLNFSEKKAQTSRNYGARKKSVKLKENLVKGLEESGEECERKPNSELKLTYNFIDEATANMNKELQEKYGAQEGKDRVEKQMKKELEISMAQTLPYYQPLPKGREGTESSECMDEVKRKKNVQEKYICGFLEKRNRKFRKPWGNKILIKYESRREAREMIEGCRQPTPSGTPYSTIDCRTSLRKRKEAHDKVPRDLSREDHSLLEEIKREMHDEDLYETTCRNQKFNLFLRQNH